MKKTLLVLLLAGLLLISATACSGDDKNNTNKGTETESVTGTETGKDPLGGDSTDTDTDTETETKAPDLTEDPADFTEASLEIIVIVDKATLRNAPSTADSTYLNSIKKDYVLTVTGESNNWYRVTEADYDTPCYISKKVARDKAVVDAFVDGDPVNVKMTGISVGNEAEKINVRTYPSSDSNLNDAVVVGTITEGTVVVRIAESDGWSKILFQGKDDTEPKAYYVSSDFFTVVEENTDTDTDTATETTAEA